MCTLVALDLALTNIAVALLAVAIQQCIVATNPAFTVTIESIVRWVSELVRQEGRKEGKKVSRPRRLRHATHYRDAAPPRPTQACGVLFTGRLLDLLTGRRCRRRPR